MSAVKPFDEALRERFTAYIDAQGEGGATQVSKALGYSKSVISQYRNGKYIGDVAQLEGRIRNLLDTSEAAADLYAVSEYVPTSFSRHVYETIRMCHLKGGFAVECGDAGIGKTTAAKKYLRDYASNTYYISVNPCMSNVSPFLAHLCGLLNITASRRESMWVDIAKYLRGAKRVLIVDEAQHLPIKTIETLRALVDDNPDLGIVFIGNHDTITQRIGVRRASFAQISNRTRLTEVRYASETLPGDMDMLFPALAGHQAELEYLLGIAKSESAIRGAVYLYSNAADAGDTSLRALRYVANKMHVKQA